MSIEDFAVSVEVVVPPYRILASPDQIPSLHADYQKHAVLAEEFDLSFHDHFCFFAIGDQTAGWPHLVVSQRYERAGGWNPGVLVIPETHTAFIGAGTRLLAYRLGVRPNRLWVDQADLGFWRWSRHQDVVLMSAELELAAWTSDGKKLWTTFVEPPWDYAVAGDRIEVNVMGSVSVLDLRSGSPAA